MLLSDFLDMALVFQDLGAADVSAIPQRLRKVEGTKEDRVQAGHSDDFLDVLDAFEIFRINPQTCVSRFAAGQNSIPVEHAVTGSARAGATPAVPPSGPNFAAATTAL